MTGFGLGTAKSKLSLWLENAKTAVLLGLLAAVAAGAGYVVLGLGGLAAAVVLYLLIAGTCMGIPSAFVMRAMSALPLGAREAPELHELVRRLSMRAELAPPALFLLPLPQPNAVAVRTARDRGALAVSHGALQTLTPEELEAVVAHELAHLAHGDTKLLQGLGLVSALLSGLLRVGLWLGFVVFVFVGAGFTKLALVAAVALLVPVAIRTLHAAIARSREFAADAAAARLTGNPAALAHALTRIEAAHSSRGHAAVNVGPGGLLARWLGSHPSTALRVARLQRMAADVPEVQHPTGAPRRARRIRVGTDEDRAA